MLRQFFHRWNDLTVVATCSSLYQELYLAVTQDIDTVVDYCASRTNDVTTGGTNSGLNCCSEFMYNGVVRQGCTTAVPSPAGDNRAWCSVNSNYAGLNQWGYCDDQTATTTPRPDGITLRQAVNLPRTTNAPLTDLISTGIFSHKFLFIFLEINY